MKPNANVFVVTLLLVPAAPVLAQTFPIDPETRQTDVQGQGDGLAEVARTVDTGVGEIGQRQTQEDTAPNIEPLRRLDNRVENRIQNRLRNRVDRSYDQTANTTAPFERAEENSRASSRRGPR